MSNHRRSIINSADRLDHTKNTLDWERTDWNVMLIAKSNAGKRNKLHKSRKTELAHINND